MKKNLLVLLILLLAVNHSRSQVYFNRVYRSPLQITIGASVCKTDSGYVMLSELVGTNKRSGMLTKLNNAGDTIWQKIYSSQLAYTPLKIYSVKNGYIVTGSVADSINSNNSDAFLQKYDLNGNSLWIKRYGGPEFDGASDVALTNEGGYLTVGSTSSFGHAGNIYVIETDSVGNEIKSYKYSDYLFADGRNISKTIDKGYIIGGYQIDSLNYSHPYVIKLDSLYNQQWAKTYGTKEEEDDAIAFPVQTKDGNYIIGTANYKANNYRQAYLAKINTNGNLIWKRKFTFLRNFTIYSKPIETSDGGFVMTGGGQDTSFTFTGVVMKVNALGDTTWTKKYYVNSKIDNYFYDFIKTNDNGYLACGSGVDSTGIIQYAWLVKMDCSGNDSIHYKPDRSCNSIVNNISNSEAKTNELIITPNPFSEIAAVNYQIVRDTHLSIYDIQGKLIQSILLLHNQNSITIDGSLFENGVYFYGIDGYSEKQKMLVLH